MAIYTSKFTQQEIDDGIDNANSALQPTDLDNYYDKDTTDDFFDKKVDKVSGKGLSTNDYTTNEKNKLAGIAKGAEVNVQSDWDATSGDAFIKNKPTIPDSFQWYGKSSTAANTVQKEVSIPSITSLKTGQIIVVQPTVTSTVADSTLKLNSFDAYPMRYNNAAITTSTDSIVWAANIPSLFVFDGSYWVFLGHGLDSNTTYSAMSVAEGTTGTATSARTMRADYLKQIIQAWAPQSDWNATSGNAVILNKPTIPTVNNGKFSIKGAGTEVASTTSNASSASSVDIVAGSNVTVTPDATNKKITIAATDTTYSAATTSAAGLMSAEDKTKLDGIATGATKVTTDTVSGWGYTKNVGTVTGVKMNGTTKSPSSGVVDLGTVITSHQDISGKVDKTTTVNGHALSGNVSVTKSDVGLGNVTNDAQVKRSEMGAASGVATLDSNGKVPSSQLPSYVDDVIEGYFYNSKFYKESEHTTEITGETGKIYVDLSTNKTYRWGGSAYAVISETLALGETSSTAYRGDRGKTAYTHSQTTSGNPHNVTKSDVGLGNVGNFKAVSTVASQGLSDTEKANARVNIGAGTSSFSGSYNDLSDKPTIPAAAANGTYTVKTLVGSTTTNVSDFTANQSSADDVTFVQGSNVTITPDATNRKITIASSDTKNTAGSTDSSSKLFLIGATSQADNPQTYSQDTVYVGTDGHLYSNNKKVLDVAGGTLESLNGIVSTANKNTKVVVDVTALSQSPIPKYLWHDLFAFCRTEVPLYYTTSDNSTWTAATASKLPFNQKDGDTAVSIISATGKTGSRWQWDYTLQWSSAKWLVIGFRYKSNPATVSVLVETSSDGTTWTTRHSTASVKCGSTPVWFYLEDFDSDSKLRLTITKNTSDTTKTASIGCIKLLTTRWGSQGLGSEYEYPYNWDADGNIFSISAGNRDLGATNNYWKNLYITNINGVAVGSSPKFTDTTYDVVSTSANGLVPKVTDTSKFLKGDGTWATPTDTNNRMSFYGTCDTAADTAEKAVTISDTAGWELKAGTIVGIKFTNTNSASNVTLNVNGSGAKSIWYNNAAYTGNSNSICGYAGRVTYYMYDGTYWVWLNMGSLDGNTDKKVTQTVTTTSADYEVLFSNTADNTTRTEGARKNSNLKFNPSTGNLQATQLNGVTIGSSPKFTDTTYSVMGGSGASHASGLVPDPGATAGTTKYLREDGTWQEVYTREEIDQKLAFRYDPTTKGMVFPTDTSIVEYDADTKGMIFH